jgi:hypothetical protein
MSTQDSLVLVALSGWLLACGTASPEAPSDTGAETSSSDVQGSGTEAEVDDAVAPVADVPAIPSEPVDAIEDVTADPIGDAIEDVTADAVIAPVDIIQDTEADSATIDSAVSPEDVPAPTDTEESPSWAALPLCSGGVIAAAIAPQLPKSAGADAFTPWAGDGWEGVTGLITTLQSGDIDTALEALAAVAYTACRGSDAEAELLLFTPTESGTGHARAVWRMGAARALVLEAPHPVFDMDTGVEAATLFEATQARGLIVSGTHRCVSDVPSGCDGTTKVCTGSSAPYPLTDMAHVGVSLFQAFHEAFQAGLEDLAISADNWEYLLISVHGMAGDGISLSNGTSSEGDVDSLPAKLYLALKGALPDAYVTSCNSFEGAVVDKRLCGSTNTQGRHTNGVVEPCTTSALAASGRFAHMEQALEIRQSPAPVAEALLEVFSLVD